MKTSLLRDGADNVCEPSATKARFDGARRYLYRVRFENASALVTLVLDKDGKITGLATDLE